MSVEVLKPCFLYHLYDAQGRVLYVGMTDDVEARMNRHRFRDWWPLVADRWVVTYPTRAACAAAEALTIHLLRPPHNIAVPNGQRCGTLKDRADVRDLPSLEVIQTIDRLRCELEDARQSVISLRRQLGRERAAHLAARQGIGRLERRNDGIDVETAAWVERQLNRLRDLELGSDERENALRDVARVALRRLGRVQEIRGRCEQPTLPFSGDDAERWSGVLVKGDFWDRFESSVPPFEITIESELHEILVDPQQAVDA